jgi:hypothetical protein
MAEQLKQNDTRIAYVVSSGNYHRKVYQNGSSYVLKSYSKTGIKVDITALTTNTSNKSTYSGTIFIYKITSSQNRYTAGSSGRTLNNGYTTTSSNSIDIYASSTISESVSSDRNTYITLSYTNTSIKNFSSSSIDTRLRTTTLSEFNGQSSTSYTTNRYDKALSYYSISNTYPNYSFTTTGNKWNVTIGGYAYYTTTSVPNYGTTPRSIKGLQVTSQGGDCYTFVKVTSYTSQLSETTTFTSYVSSTTY